MPVRLNIGCGMAPTPDWLNYDNSLAVRLARWPLAARMLRAIGVLDAGNYEFVDFCRRHGVRHANAVARIPHESGSVDVVYSSHMIEHLDRWEAGRFLAECRRVLKPGGVLRILVPDLRVTVRDYVAKGNADVFLDHLQLELYKPHGLRAWLRHQLVGGRNHRWLYDGPSIHKFIAGNGFDEVRLVQPGETRIAEPGMLDLREREHESAMVEAIRPVR
jgi:predicted SAM-dependent methyltransferase